MAIALPKYFLFLNVHFFKWSWHTWICAFPYNEVSAWMCSTAHWKWLSESDLSIEVVSKAVDKLRLNGVLLSQQRQIVSQLVMCSDDGPVSQSVVLRSASPAKYLHDVKHAKVNERTFLWIVDLCALKQSCIIKQNGSLIGPLKDMVFIADPLQCYRQDHHIPLTSHEHRWNSTYVDQILSL